MPSYEVSVYKTVSDVTRCVLEIEAGSQDEAIEKARHRAENEDLEFQWWQCDSDASGQLDFEVLSENP